MTIAQIITLLIPATGLVLAINFLDHRKEQRMTQTQMLTWTAILYVFLIVIELSRRWVMSS